MTLTEFLLARITEDEANATSSDVLQRAMTAAWPGLPPGLSIDEATRRTRAALVAAGLDAGRALAECEAKRRIVERCSDVGALMPSEHLAQGVLSLLALPYADHPDCQPEWRP